jgi:hypothetical protein
MLIFDIDQTLVQPHFEDQSTAAGEVRKVFGFNLYMADHLLNLLRSREDIHLLSTWGEEAAGLAEAFEFEAKTLLIRDYSDEGGIHGKFAAVRELKPLLWADDQITTLMANWCLHFNVISITPKRGSISEAELEIATKSLFAIEQSR